MSYTIVVLYILPPIKYFLYSTSTLTHIHCERSIIHILTPTNTRAGQEIRSLTGHSDWVTSVAFSPDGTQIASGSGDKTVRVWSVETGVYTCYVWVTSVGIFVCPTGLLCSGVE